MNAMPCDEYVPPLETVFIVEAVSERAIVPVRSPLAPKIATRSSTITSSAITKAKRKARKKNQLERSTSKGITGGYILRGRGEVRSGGAIVPIGNSRTCMADACRVVAHELKVSISERVCREGLRCALTDPSMTDAHAFMRMHGIKLTHHQALDGSVKGLLSQPTGVFLIRLEIILDGGESDFHMLAYNAGSKLMFDNEPGAKVPEIEPSDWASSATAVKIYKHMFPNAFEIIQKSVFQASII
jgi:hypothetical protein